MLASVLVVFLCGHLFSTCIAFQSESNFHRLKIKTMINRGDFSVKDQSESWRTSTGKENSKPLWESLLKFSSSLSSRLADSGQAGILAYGMLNFLYYSTTTLLAWNFSFKDDLSGSTLRTLNMSRRLTYVAQRALKVSAIVWAGSQVTKGLRIMGAIVLAPLGDAVLKSIQTKFSIASRNAAFWLLVRIILLTSVSLYLLLILSSSIILTR